MCGGGGGQTSNSMNFQNSTSTYTPNPYALSMMYGAMSGAQNLYLAPFQQYEGQRIAGYNQDQLAAMQGVRNLQGVTQPYLDAAGQLASNAVNYSSPANFSQANVGQYFNPLMTGFLDQTPMTFSQGAVNQYANAALNPYIENMPLAYSQQAIDTYKDPTLQAYLKNAPMEFSAENVNKYYNPYQESVINATQNRLAQQERQQQAALMAQQAKSGAFGGNRSALNRAYLAGQQGLNRENILSGLQQQGYNQALGAFQQQQAQALAVAQAEQQRAQAMYQQQQGLGFNARTQQYSQALDQFNRQQQAALNAAQQGYTQALGQYNQQQQQAINAAQQGSYAMSQLGNQAQQAELQGLQALFGAGSLQQQMEQQGLNQAYEDWAVQQAWPYQQLAAYAQLAAGIAPLTGGTTNTQSFGFGQNQQQGGGGGAAGAAMSGLGALMKFIPGIGSFLPGAARGGRINRSNGGGFGGLKSTVAENPQAIDLYTGVAPPAAQYTDLSSLAYPTDPAFSSSLYEKGLGAILSPAEQNEILEEKWTSDPAEAEFVELEPFEYEEIDRSEKAGGGGIGELAPPKVTSAFEANPLLRRKESPYGEHGNPLIAAARKDMPKPAKPVIPEHIKPGETKAPPIPQGDALGGVGKAIGDIGAGLGALKKTPAAAPHAAPEAPEFPATPAAEETPMPPERPADLGAAAPAGEGALGALGDIFKGFGLKHGGVARNGYADGGSPLLQNRSPLQATATSAVPDAPRSSASYQAQIDALSRPTPRPVMPSDAMRNYGKATGQTVGQAWGPRGLGLPLSKNERDYRLPWKQTNQGSGAYNQMLLGASRYIRPTQMTPAELGFPSMQEEGPYYEQRQSIYSPDYIENAGKWGQGAGGGNAGLMLGMMTGNMGLAMAGAAQNAQADAAAAAKKGDWEAYNKAILKMPRKPSGYIWKFTGRIQPDGTMERIPVRPTYQPLFNKGGAVRHGLKSGGRTGIWGRLQDAGEDVKAAALSLKEDALHPLEVMQSIIQRARSGKFPGGTDPVAVMAAKSQYEPMNPKNRGTSRDPRTVNPNDPRVQELAQKYHELKAGKLDTGIGNATSFMNPDIVKSRRGLHSWESKALHDPAAVRVGSHLFYDPSGNAVASSRMPAPIKPTLGASTLSSINPADPSGPLMGQNAPASPQITPEAASNPIKTRLDEQWENRPRFDYANKGEPIEADRAPLPGFSNADVSGGVMNMPRGFGDVYKLDEPTPRPGPGLNMVADLSPAPTGANALGITHDFEQDQPQVGFVNRGHPATAPGYREPAEGMAGFGAISPDMTPEEPSMLSPGMLGAYGTPQDRKDYGRAPVEMPTEDTGIVSEERPAPAPVHHMSPRHSVERHHPVHHERAATAHPMQQEAPDQSFGGLDIGGLFGDEQQGQGGFDFGDLFKDVELDLPNFDIGSLFNRGGAVRQGLKSGGSPRSSRAREAWDYLINEAGATPAEAEVLIPAAAAESGFNPEAIHDQGTGYGLFGHRLERADALRKALGDRASDLREQLGYGLKEFRSRPEHRFIEGENPSIEDIMQAHGAFERPQGYKSGHPEGMKNYAGRRALTEALIAGDLNAFNNYNGGGGGGGRGGFSPDSVVAMDPEAAGGLGGLKGFIDKNRGGISDLGDFLLASGFGAMASRNPSTLGAIGEGGLRGIEALNAGRASRNAMAMQQLQAQNLMSEIAKRNFETGETVRQAQERRNIAAGKPTAAKKAAPTAPKITSDAGQIAIPAEGPVTVAQQGQPPEVVAAEPVPRVTPQEELSRRAPPEYQAEKFESGIAEATAEAEEARQKAEQSREAGLLQDAKEYEAQEKQARDRAKGLREEARKARETPFPIAGEDLKKDYEATQAAGRKAQDRITNLRRLQKVSQDPEVYQGFQGENILVAKKAVRAAEDFSPKVKSFTESMGLSPSRKGIALSEELGSEASRSLKDELGSLGNGTSNRDVDIAMRTQAGLGNSPEGNQILFAQKIRIAERQQEIAEFQRKYIAERGGLDANYNTALQKWSEANPMFDADGEPTEATMLPGKSEKGKGKSDKSEGKTVVRRGRDASGRAVVKYSDGTVGYAD